MLKPLVKRGCMAASAVIINGFQLNFNIGSPQSGLYFGRKKVKPTLNKNQTEIYTKIKFDQI